MASGYRYVQRPAVLGFDRSTAAHLTPEGTGWDCVNWRPSSGYLKQTPPFGYGSDLALGQLGGSATQQVRHLSIIRQTSGDYKYLCLTDENGRYVDPSSWAETELAVVLQTSVPSGDTVYKECLVWGWDTTNNLPAASGTVTATIVTGSPNTVTVAVSSGPAAGSYAGLAIAQETAVGATGLKVGFVPDGEGTVDPANYTVGNAWVWTRDSFPTNAHASTTNYNYSNTYYGIDEYIGGPNRNVLRLRNDILTSVGYTRTYGKYVEEFYNHLIIGQYANTSTYDSTTTPFVLGWSHVRNPDNFRGTDINEADTYTFTTPQYIPGREQGITGVKNLGQYCYIYLNAAIHRMEYVGLPNVMQITEVFKDIGNRFSGSLVRGKRGHYFWGIDNFYLNDGLSYPQPIGEPVKDRVFEELFNPGDTEFDQVWSYYDDYNSEVVWIYPYEFSATATQLRAVVYRELDNSWYFRNFPNVSTGSSAISASCPVFAETDRRLYGGDLKLYLDYASDDATITQVENDTLTGEGSSTLTIGASETRVVELGDILAIPESYDTNGPVYETKDYFYTHLGEAKEIFKLLLDAAYSGTVDGIAVQFSVRNRLSQAVTWQTAGNWTPNLHEKLLTSLRTKGRIFRFKFIVTPTAGDNFAYDSSLYSWGEYIRGEHKEMPVR